MSKLRVFAHSLPPVRHCLADPSCVGGLADRLFASSGLRARLAPEPVRESVADGWTEPE